MRRPVILALALLLSGCAEGAGGKADAALFCDRLDRLTQNDPFLAFGDTATAAEIEQGFAALVERADELLEVSPDEARGAARDYAEAATALDSLLAGAGYDGDLVDARAYRAEQLSYSEAADRLLRYLNTQC